MGKALCPNSPTQCRTVAIPGGGETVKRKPKKTVRRKQQKKTVSQKQRKTAQRAAVPKQLATDKRKSPSKTSSKTGACCLKDHWHDLKEGDGACFTAAHQRGKPNVTTHCTGRCKLKFVGDDVPKSKVDKLTCVKITMSSPAHMCPNAQDIHHLCKYAMCKNCVLHRDANEKQVYLKDGDWVTEERIAEDANEPASKRRKSRRATGFAANGENVVTNGVLLAPGERMVGKTVVAHGILQWAIARLLVNVAHRTTVVAGAL